LAVEVLQHEGAVAEELGAGAHAVHGGVPVGSPREGGVGGGSEPDGSRKRTGRSETAGRRLPRRWNPRATGCSSSVADRSPKLQQGGSSSKW
jgi:hypothetical protein